MTILNEPVAFEKIHACGNDFLLVEKDLPADVIAKICDRHHGLGADGIMVKGDIKGSEVEFRHFDPDGSRSFCLNGIRASLMTLFQKKMVPQQGTVVSEGVYLTYIIDSQVAVGLPVRPYRRLIWSSGSDTIPGYFCDVGNPHFVCWDVPELEFRQLSPRIRADMESFPEGANVNWLKMTENGWLVRTYERGVEDFTLSCGSGMYACALVLAGELGLNQIVFLPQGQGEVRTWIRDEVLFMSGTTSWVAGGNWRC